MMHSRPSLLALAQSAAAEGRRPRVAVAGISQESNSFNPRQTRLEDFRPVVPGPAEAFVSEARKTSTTIAGFVEGTARLGLDLVPGVLLEADPLGPVQRAAFEILASDLVGGLADLRGKLDGVYLSLHGAMIVDGYESGDAELVRRVREAMGPEVPVVVTHDFHANITSEIVLATDALITYKENPHIDTKDCGAQAAVLMAGITRRIVRPVQAIVKPPMLYNIVYQHTKRAPLLPIVEESRRLETMQGVLAASVAGGYQYADLPQMGPSVVVVTDGDAELARREAARLADLMWGSRHEIVLRLPDVRSAVAEAASCQRHPVVLMDLGDNIGGGSAGNSTFILDELLHQRATGWVVTLADPAAVAAAARAGVGQCFTAAVGGAGDGVHGRPIPLNGRVRSIHEGKFVEPEVRHLGTRYHDMGLVAVIEAAGSTPDLPNLVVLTTLRTPPYSLHQLISLGIYPERQRILVVKGAIAPRAAYEPIAALIIAVDTPGATSVNPSRFPYKNVRRPLFGME